MRQVGVTVTHRVKNSDNITVGFIANNVFINTYMIRANISSIDNLAITKSGSFRATKELPIIYYKDLNRQTYKKIQSESPFKRDIEDILENWRKRKNREVLQLNGPRQCGKTTELKKFAYKNYEYIIYIDLSDNSGKLFSEILNNRNTTDINILIDFMQSYCERANLPQFKNNNRTILIIDEIQLSSTIYNSIRTIRNKYDIDIIVTGSYLGVTVFNKEFFLPAGTIEEIHMLPLSFREFVRIYNKHKILDSISLNSESNANDYESLHALYTVYRKIGGYPDVIKEYIRSNDIKQCMKIIGRIINIFTQESRNYFDTTKHDIIFKSLYSSVFIQMCSNKKGNGTKLVEDVTQIIKDGTKMVISRDEISKSLLWIMYSKVVGQCDLCVDGNITNILPARRFYYLDCGMANYISNTTGVDKTTIDGLITETFAYSELYRLYINTYSLDKVKGDYPNFSTYGQYELDFMVLGTDDKIYGIEVKTTDGETKSLKVYVQKGFINKGIVAKKTTGHRGDKVQSIPIWAIGCRFPYNN